MDCCIGVPNTFGQALTRRHFTALDSKNLIALLEVVSEDRLKANFSSEFAAVSPKYLLLS